ncbi:TPA: ISAs1 family transposase [Legionella pneumophila]|uniref:ISAs1 family transposase n=1 Tax=Legionella pneumophila TaxID=446 RepID=UPI0011AE8A9C|nr:ISAs1 family transposase [Legionella pneumophila]HAT9047688.1 ISAs1 family transposase [Legionella pneumophila subsp. pneumophila]HAT8236901.1 ISAs1 family transposase [Legionella pneumophila]HAT8240568.1 ISAs1 family transposase [Legionella pneumophila]HAT8244277.1 ISAs1 family transposase [Legionella pneumophila]
MFFSTAIEKNFAAVEHSRAEENDYGHGRIESRVCYSVPLPNYLNDFSKEWSDLKSLACIISSRDINNVVTKETRYYVSSLEANAHKINHAIRCHWHVENLCIGLWMILLKKMIQELDAELLRKT